MIPFVKFFQKNSENRILDVQGVNSALAMWVTVPIYYYIGVEESSKYVQKKLEIKNKIYIFALVDKIKLSTSIKDGVSPVTSFERIITLHTLEYSRWIYNHILGKSILNYYIKI